MGWVELEAEGGALTALRFCDAPPAAAPAPCALLWRAEGALREYFAGQRQVLSLPLAPEGTDFQRAVWAQLAAIPFGEARSYGQVAAALGRPKAARAVGMACTRNPIAILIPCHRVVGAGGALTGYAGGLWRKEALLRLEGAVL